MKCPLRHDRRFLSSLPSVLFLSRFIPSSFFPTRHLTIVFIRFSFSYGTHTSSHAAQSLSERNLIDHFLILFSPMNLAEWLQSRALGPFFCLFFFWGGGEVQQGPRNGFLITERRGDRFGKEQKSLWWGRLIMIVKRGNDPKRTGPLTGRHTRIMKSYSVIRHQTVQRGETGRGGQVYELIP